MLVFVFSRNTFDLEWCSNCAKRILWCQKSKSK